MSHRPYRPGYGIDAALEEIESKKGILYDSDVVDVGLNLFRENGFRLELFGCHKQRSNTLDNCISCVIISTAIKMELFIHDFPEDI